MVLIIGGAYQGKLDYAKEEFGLTDSDVFTCEEGSTAVGFDEKVVDHFERYIFSLIKAGQVPEKAVGMQLRANRYKGRIIICDDISQGVVPMDAAERAWREGVGRTMVKIAQQADKVIRVFCGIPVVLKDETAAAASQNPSGTAPVPAVSQNPAGAAPAPSVTPGGVGSAPSVTPAPKPDGLEAVFASELNGAVKPADAASAPAADAESGDSKPSGDVAESAAAADSKPASGAAGRAQPASPVIKPADQPHGAGGRGQGAAPRTPFGVVQPNPFEHYDFGNAAEGGLTPEEQFRINFEKMKAERKAAREKAAKEAAAKGDSEDK